MQQLPGHQLERQTKTKKEIENVGCRDFGQSKSIGETIAPIIIIIIIAEKMREIDRKTGESTHKFYEWFFSLVLVV